MTIDLTPEEIEILRDMVNYAEDPCGDSTFWCIIYEDEGEEEGERLSKIADRAKDKLYKAAKKAEKTKSK